MVCLQLFQNFVVANFNDPWCFHHSTIYDNSSASVICLYFTSSIQVSLSLSTYQHPHQSLLKLPIVRCKTLVVKSMSLSSWRFNPITKSIERLDSLAKYIVIQTVCQLLFYIQKTSIVGWWNLIRHSILILYFV